LVVEKRKRNCVIASRVLGGEAISLFTKKIVSSGIALLAMTRKGCSFPSFVVD
jgi:hypothetical protein